MPGIILVVEDDPTILKILLDLLQQEGYQANGITSGTAALEAIIDSPPDLVISDVKLPGLDGRFLAGRIRERGIPVILMSASPQLLETNAVANAFLPKPFDLDHVLETVSTLLTASKSAPSATFRISAPTTFPT